MSRNDTINFVSSNVTHVCEIMTAFTNYDITSSRMMSSDIFWYQNVCKWIDYTVCLASLVIIVLLVRKLQMGRQKGSLERNSSINSIVLWRLLIQTHTKLSITEKKRNVAKYLTWNSVRLCKFCKKFMKKGTVNFLKKGPKGGLGIFRF